MLIFPAGGFSFHGKAGEVQVVEFDFRFYGGVVLFVLLMLEIADRVVMKRDLEIARDIQSWLLPATPPPVPGMAIAFATRPANTVAGDYYDVFARPASDSGDARFLLTVADVAGKSIPAALLMATFQASLRTLSATPSSLADMVSGMNSTPAPTARAACALLPHSSQNLIPPHGRSHTSMPDTTIPFSDASSGTVEYLVAGGLPLGIRAEAAYESGSTACEPGDWLVIFTDGLVEAMNERDDEYGEPRLLDVLRTRADSGSRSCCAACCSDGRYLRGRNAAAR